MTKFNLRKKMAATDSIVDKQIEENRDEMDLSNEKQGTTDKNINFSLPVKEEDATVPFNARLEASRKKEEDQQIIESRMSKKQVLFGEQKDEKTAINAETQKYVDKKEKDYKKAEGKIDTETAFWDKIVGIQLEGEKTKVPNNLPDKGTQLPNKKVSEEEIKSLLKDADAMLFHIYATARKQGRDLNSTEKQQVVDINSGKTRLLAQMVEPVKRSFEYGDPIIKKTDDNKFEVLENDGKVIDKFSSLQEARANYPEALEDKNE